jgi:hypothetical protein
MIFVGHKCHPGDWLGIKNGKLLENSGTPRREEPSKDGAGLSVEAIFKF